jgi:uncharacterized protein (TIGR02246 family)
MPGCLWPWFADNFWTPSLVSATSGAFVSEGHVDDPERERLMSQTEIGAVNRAFEDAVSKGDSEKIASLYTRDAIALPPDAPMVRGREKIRELWASVMKDLGLKAANLNTRDLEVAGDTAYEVGEAALALGSQNAVVKYVVVWKKVEGQWKLHRDIWNAMPSK